MNKTDKIVKNLKVDKKVNSEKINLKQNIRRIPEFKGVVFWDITTF